MRRLIAVAVFATCGLLAIGQSTAKKKSPAAKSAAVTKKQAVAKSASKKTAAPPPRRYVQQQPTPDRYREIQQALVEKGYFSGTADGNWGPESVEALKRFQRDQNIADDGKIGSLSLIALGLGPKRTQPAGAAKPGEQP
jgi:peptidoglycan hydrolase-like protein with peptidoglycan-binding domain